MSLKKTRDFKSQTKRRRSESERTANNLARPSECKNKRATSKRAASPTPSYLSVRTDWSMDPPTNFKGGETFPLHSRIKRKRETSPVTSYISLKSDNPVNDSRGNTSMLRVRADSPTPTCFSLRTDWSMDPPTNFRAAETDQRLLTDHHLRCSLCKSMLKDPVSIPCGHNYCRGCINEFWVSCAGDYVCPQCGNTSEIHPVLNTNTALAEVVKNLQQAAFSPALPAQYYAGPEDVACDFCTERRLKAVKCCSTCDVFLCETHVKQHYTIAALQKHTLSDVTRDMKTRPSQQHQNTVSSFTVSGQQDQTDKTFEIIKDMAVRSIFESVLKPGKLQTQPKRSIKPKTRDNKDVRNLALMCSTLKQEVSGLKKQLSKISKRKNTKKEKHYEENYGKEEDKDCSEKDSDERSDDEGRDDASSEEEEDGSENSSDEEEDGSDEEDGEEDNSDDEEDSSAYSDEGSDDKYSEGYNDHSSEEYSTEDKDDDY